MFEKGLKGKKTLLEIISFDISKLSKIYGIFQVSLDL